MIIRACNGCVDQNPENLVPRAFYDVSIVYLDLLKYPLLKLPNAVRACSGARTAYIRIRDYLNLPAYKDRRQISAVAGSVEMKNFPVGPSTKLKNWLVSPGSLWIVQGAVKSYKVWHLLNR